MSRKPVQIADPALSAIPLRPPITPWDDWNYVLLEDWCGVPRGFITDGASLPRLLWRVFGHPLDPRTIGPAICHDFAYQTGCIPRKCADANFREDLRFNGVGRIKAALFYFGVRLFGWAFYNNTQTQTKGQDK